MSRSRTEVARRGTQTQLVGIAARQLIALALVCGLLWILQDRFAEIDLAGVKQAFVDVRPGQWVMAAFATLASFWAIGRYDAVLHGVLGTGIGVATARRAGMVAIGTAQFAGFGVLTGALVRWRMIPEMSLWQATRLSLAVSVSFLAGWAVFTAVLLLIAPFGPEWLISAALATVAGAIGLVFLSLWQPWFLSRLPSVTAMVAVLGLAVLDTSFACLALWALLPADLAVSPMMLAPAFLLALGAGLVGGTPGGLGPFELTLLGLLPIVPADPLLGAALAFRLVYHAIPAAIAVLFLVRGSPAPQRDDSAKLLAPFRNGRLPPELEPAIWNAPQAEAQLLRQSEFGLLRSSCGAALLAANTGQTLVLFRNGLARQLSPIAWLDHATRTARQHRVSPLHYKCSARTAAAARQRGWSVLAVSDEAHLDPASFTLDRAGCRQLRRLLRKAETAGVAISEAGQSMPLQTMAAISAEWVRANGGERGFSMGRFDARCLQGQRVFLAHHDGQLVAFVSFNEVAAEWSLDLMRQVAGAPCGTMHALVAHAIARAAACGCPRLSLAAVPRDRALRRWLPRRVQSHLSAVIGGAGLRRFKSSFAPDWTPLFATAPSRLALAVGLAEVARCVSSPKRR